MSHEAEVQMITANGEENLLMCTPLQMAEIPRGLFEITAIMIRGQNQCVPPTLSRGSMHTTSCSQFKPRVRKVPN